MLKKVHCIKCSGELFYLKSLDGSKATDATPICANKHCRFDQFDGVTEEEKEKMLKTERLEEEQKLFGTKK